MYTLAFGPKILVRQHMAEMDGELLTCNKRRAHRIDGLPGFCRRGGIFHPPLHWMNSVSQFRLIGAFGALLARGDEVADLSDFAPYR